MAKARTANDDRLQVGWIVRDGGRIWRVGLVNNSRARLDPVSGVASVSPVSGRSFEAYGSSVNVSPQSVVPQVDETTLTLAERARIITLEERELEEQMAETQTAKKSADVADMPVPKKSLKEQNEERRATLAAKKDKLKADKAAAGSAEGAEGAVVKSKTPKPCKCGCGGQTTRFFVPGHDARFKSWLLKIERGQAKPEDLLTEAVRQSYTWKKTVDGKGLIPTTNYKGEPHTGYDS